MRKTYLPLALGPLQVLPILYFSLKIQMMPIILFLLALALGPLQVLPHPVPLFDDPKDAHHTLPASTSLEAAPSTTHPKPLSDNPNSAHRTFPAVTACEAIPPGEDNPNPQLPKTTQEGIAYANQEYLRDLFPQVPHSRITEVSHRFLVTDAIDHFVQWNDTYVSMSRNVPVVSPTIDLTCTTENVSWSSICLWFVP